MEPLEAYRNCISKYAEFQGRARRSEYWYFFLCNFVIGLLLFGLGSVSGFLGFGISCIYSLFAFLPGLAVTIRRLHDTGHSGAHYFLILIPLVGPIILLAYMCRDSVPGDNQYGTNPKEAPVPAGQAANGMRQNLPQANYDTPKVNCAADTPDRRFNVRAACITGLNVSAGGDVVYVGRDPEKCQMLFNNVPGVSKLHCVLYTNGDSILIKDLNSSYGTYLSNGVKLAPNTPTIIQNGSRVYIGSRNVAISVELIPA